MARAIIRMPMYISRGILKLVNAALTLVLVIFCYVTGQMPKSASSNESNVRPASSITGFFRSTLLSQISPDYGITPLYGVVEYGVPYADFNVTGTIRSEETSGPIEGIQVTLKDTAVGTVLATSSTDEQGAFSLSLQSDGTLDNTWLLRAEDIDGNLNGGLFTTKDTVITIPQDSLKGGDGWYAGSAETTVELFLEEHIVRNTNRVQNVSADLPVLRITQLSRSQAELRFSLVSPGAARLRVYDASGKFKTELFDREFAQGAHVISVDISSFAGGACFFRLDNGGYSRVTKALLAR